MKIVTTNLLVGVVAILCATGCSKPTTAPSEVPTPKNYTIVIEGTSGLEVDLLMITKPTANSIEREEVTITVPFRKSFQAVKHTIWIDSEYRGKEGEYSVILRQNGQPVGELESCFVKSGHKNSGRLGDL